jgi:hypothetical protein
MHHFRAGSDHDLPDFALEVGLLQCNNFNCLVATRVAIVKPTGSFSEAIALRDLGH